MREWLPMGWMRYRRKVILDRGWDWTVWRRRATVPSAAFISGHGTMRLADGGTEGGGRVGGAGVVGVVEGATAAVDEGKKKLEKMDGVATFPAPAPFLPSVSATASSFWRCRSASPSSSTDVQKDSSEERGASFPRRKPLMVAKTLPPPLLPLRLCQM